MTATYAHFLREYSGSLSSAPGLSLPAPARFLVISDLHGSNRLGLVEAILAEEGRAGRPVSAVLVLGDLVNFGFPAELRVRGFARSLARLPVPVLVVLGNHDKHGLLDRSVARYLAKVPNVVLMQAGPEYTFAHVGPICVGGFDDPRYFGDDNTGNAKKQHPAREAFLAAATWAGEAPDVVMVHEPAAAGGCGALWLNGHMHAPLIDAPRRRVQVGMFTDGAFYYNRATHRRAPSNFVLLAVRNDPESTSVASVTFRWRRRTPCFETVDTAEITPGRS